MNGFGDICALGMIRLIFEIKIFFVIINNIETELTVAKHTNRSNTFHHKINEKLIVGSQHNLIVYLILNSFYLSNSINVFLLYLFVHFTCEMCSVLSV